MTWAGFYLVCFVVGFALAVVGFLSGTFHWPFGHGHLPSLHGHAPHLPHLSHAAGHGVAATGASQAAGLEAVGSRVASGSPYNFATFMAFLAWFGGVGYLLTTRGNFSRAIVLGAALASGAAGGAIVFGFLTRVLLGHERELQAADFEMVGVLGRVTVPIRVQGTGEIVYSQEGTRRSAGARSEAGGAIERGCEVIVTRYERGIAYVRPFEELAGMDGPAEISSASPESRPVSPFPS